MTARGGGGGAMTWGTSNIALKGLHNGLKDWSRLASKGPEGSPSPELPGSPVAAAVGAQRGEEHTPNGDLCSSCDACVLRNNGTRGVGFLFQPSSAPPPP